MPPYAVRTYADFGIHLDTARTSGEVYALCPRCSHTRQPQHQKIKCLGIDLDRGIWHCNHPTCDWSGSLGGRSAGSTKVRVWSTPRPYVDKPPGNGLMTWFTEKRKIDAAVVARHKITRQRIFFPQLETEADAVAYPFYRDGDLVNVMYMTYPKDGGKYCRFENGCERIFYNIDALKGPVGYITEGQVDTLSLETAGYTSVVSVPNGAPDPRAKNFAKQFDFLATAEPWLTSLTKIVLAVDTDAAGQHLADELARRLGAQRCWRVTWPEGCKDANEVLVQYGKERLRACVEAATPWPVSGIVTVDMLAPALERLYHEGDVPGLSLGWSALDPCFRVKASEVTVITGVPQHGKSFFVNHMMIRLASLYDWRFAVFSPENYPLERYISFLISQYMDRPFVGSSRLSLVDLWEAQSWLHEHFSFILPDDDEESPTLDRILLLARIQVERCGIRGLVIDPWNELDHERPSRKTETEYVSECLTKVRRFARGHGVHCFVIAHPTKMQHATRGPYIHKFPPPTAYDIAGSANWFNKPDNILCVWRDLEEETREVEIHSQKIRFRGNGCRPGLARLLFQPRTGTYVDLEQTYEERGYRGS